MNEAALYVRVSTDEQVSGTSLDNQVEQCIIKAKELGCLSWTVFRDEGVSGEVLLRPGIMDAIDDLATKKYKYFICYDQDRLSRNMHNQLILTHEIEKHAQIAFVNSNYDKTPEGKMFYYMRGVFAEFEKDIIQRRTMSGKIRKAQRGGWTHWPGIFGYNYDKGEVTVNEDEARIVQMIFELGARMGTHAIAEYLGSIGIASPRAKKRVWSRTTISRILANESYMTGITHIRKFDSHNVHNNKYVPAGGDKAQKTLRDPSEWIAMQIPPIVSEEAYKAVKHRRTNARRKSENYVRFNFLLSGLIQCGHCGHAWHGHTRTNKATGERIQYYVCTYKSPGPNKNSGIERCPSYFTHCRKIDDVVWNTVLSWLKDDSAMAKFESHKEPVAPSKPSAEIDVLKERVMSLQTSLGDIMQRYKQESIPSLRELLYEEMRATGQELDQAKSLLQELNAPQQEQAVSMIDREVIGLLRTKYHDLHKLSFEEKYEIIHSLIRSVRVSCPDKRSLNITLQV